MPLITARGEQANASLQVLGHSETMFKKGKNDNFIFLDIAYMPSNTLSLS